MQSIHAAALAGALIVSLSACETIYDYAAISEIKPPDDKFAGTLTKDLKHFAMIEVDEMYDFIDGAHFARKAERAAARQMVEPERVDDWHLDKASERQLGDGRARLMAVLDAGARQLEPVHAAHAISRFDCWIEQQEENWQWGHIAACRDDFFALLNKLEAEIILPFGGVRGLATPRRKPISAMPVRQPGLGESGLTPRAYTLLFDFDSAELGGDNLVALSQIMNTARDGTEVTVVLAGHADRAGPGWYNQALSAKRAAAVKEALIAKGMPGDSIVVSAFGERRPQIYTADGIREGRNRRVEIIIGTASAL